MKNAYESPQVVEWGKVSELTLGLGESQFTDDLACVNPGGVTFEGSAPGRCDPITD